VTGLLLSANATATPIISVWPLLLKPGSDTATGIRGSSCYGAVVAALARDWRLAR
jgi:hypothetical protein